VKWELPEKCHWPPHFGCGRPTFQKRRFTAIIGNCLTPGYRVMHPESRKWSRLDGLLHVATSVTLGHRGDQRPEPKHALL
jgi:hypothetical protein